MVRCITFVGSTAKACFQFCNPDGTSGSPRCNSTVSSPLALPCYADLLSVLSVAYGLLDPGSEGRADESASPGSREVRHDPSPDRRRRREPAPNAFDRPPSGWVRCLGGRVEHRGAPAA